VTKVIIVGAGSQGRVVADILLSAGTPAIGFVDDALPPAPLPLLGTIADLPRIAHDAVIVGIGDNRARRDMSDRLVAAGERLIVARHPFSSVAASATIGAGSVICAGAVISTGATLGRGVILNTRASVDHDSEVGDFAHVSAGATVGAGCAVGEEAMIGLAAAVLSYRSVGARTLIGAGAVVTRDIISDVVAFGVPARVMRQMRSPF
jgi:sugar O-acyltransferase (sialic acid O-acetyltransferase NeuD family)